VTKLSFWSLALLTGVGCAVVACGSDDDSGTPAGGSGGKSSGTAGKPSVGEGGASGAGGLSGSLYDRLGGHAGIQVAIGKIVGKELGDPDIASYFAPALTDKSHTPQPADIEECFTDLLGSVAGGKETYPTTLDDGYVCRSMPAAHGALHIGGDTFDHFVMIAGDELTALGVADADVATIAGVLNGTRTVIVDAKAPASGPCTAPFCDVAEGGAGGSK
jgi:hypothetical protein